MIPGKPSPASVIPGKPSLASVIPGKPSPASVIAHTSRITLSREHLIHNNGVEKYQDKCWQFRPLQKGKVKEKEKREVQCSELKFNQGL